MENNVVDLVPVIQLRKSDSVFGPNDLMSLVFGRPVNNSAFPVECLDDLLDNVSALCGGV